MERNRQGVVGRSMVMSMHAVIRKRFSVHAGMAALMALLLSLLFQAGALANTVEIHDQAGVLDVQKVQSAAAELPRRILITTTKSFSGDFPAFQDEMTRLVPDQQSVSIGVDTVHHYFALESGTQAGLTDSQANEAYIAFRDHFQGGDFTGAMIAALHSLHDSLTGQSSWSLTPVGIMVVVILGFLLVAFLPLLLTRTFRRRNHRPPDESGGGGRRAPWFWGGYYGGAYGGSHQHTGASAGGTFGGGGNFGGGAGGSFGGGGGGGSF
jgi:hypothetical protein